MTRSLRFLVCAAALLLTPALAQAQANKCADGKTIGVDTAGHCCWAGQVWSNSRNACVGIPTKCPSGMKLEVDACVATCDPGKSVSVDTAGNCCWPSQVWSNARQTCVGIPQCPTGMQANAEQCAVACAAGQVSNADTAGNCCWPNQVWSGTRRMCLGIPQCPADLRAEGEQCVAGCPAGKQITVDTNGQCCWPNQVWSASRGTCIGIPQCPPGLSVSGELCTGEAAPDLSAGLPIHPPPPLPDDGPPAVAAKEPEDPGTNRVFMALSKENDSSWNLQGDLLFDATTQRIGLRVRFDHPFSPGQSSFALGGSVGLLSPKFTFPGDSLMIVPIEVFASYRIGLAGGRVQIVPRVGPVVAVLVEKGNVAAAFKGSAGAAFRFSLGSNPGNRRGLIAGFDVLFPIIGAGWVFLISVGTTL